MSAMIHRFEGQANKRQTLHSQAMKPGERFGHGPDGWPKGWLWSLTGIVGAVVALWVGGFLG